jgi:hypothetical protein
VLLVDDDQAKLGQRSEDGQAGAEHDARFAGQGGAPVAAARGLAELAVQTDQPGGGKTRCDAGFKLWGQIDFRDQQQRLLSVGQGALNEPEIDFGLATAGHAVQEVGVEAGATLGDRVQHRLLLASQFWRRHGRAWRSLPRRSGLDGLEGAQPGRQGRQHHLAERYVIVGGAELAKAKPVCGQRRQVAKDLAKKLELLQRKIARRRQLDENPDFLLATEGHTHAVADIARRQRLAIGDAVVEEATQRNIKGDAGNLRQGHQVGEPLTVGRRKRSLVSGGSSRHFS